MSKTENIGVHGKPVRGYTVRRKQYKRAFDFTPRQGAIRHLQHRITADMKATYFHEGKQHGRYNIKSHHAREYMNSTLLRWFVEFFSPLQTPAVRFRSGAKYPLWLAVWDWYLLSTDKQVLRMFEEARKCAEQWWREEYGE